MNRLLIITLCVYCIAGCSQPQEEATVSVRSISESVYASGIVKSADQYELFSSVNGRVKKIFVEEGDTVVRGQPLLSVESTPAELNVKNARLTADKAMVSNNKNKLESALLAVQVARAKLVNDSLLVVRQRNLWSQNIGTKVDLEQKELAFTSSGITYRNALLNYHDMIRDLKFNSEQAATSLEITKSIAGDYVISALTDGRVYDVTKKVGEFVNTVAPVAVIGDSKKFIVEINVDETDVDRVVEGQRVFITMDSYKGQVFEGKIFFIEPMMNEDSRTFLVKAEFIQAPSRLFPNLTVEANILIRKKDEALVIPTRLLATDSTVIMSDGSERKIKTGLADYEWTEITEGLKAGEVIQLVQ